MTQEHIKQQFPKILVASRAMMEVVTLPKPYVVVSFSDPGAPLVDLTHDKNCLAALRVAVHDISAPCAHFFHFTETWAMRVWDFVERFTDQVNFVMCQCEAGISRSAGLAAALSYTWYGTDEFFFRTYLPNLLIYRTMLRVRKMKVKVWSTTPRAPGKD